ncbi:MAG: NAD(P)-binding domain-containing protein [Pigeon pea little leaf phytoplasma]|uniref:Glycerol-3-phosphate dehydrogenase n=1 Tax=Candidatus Phytoplasma fabacearum TaxID=2982628 RepID=A0ABU8ZSE6_9MOLU|nr:NAD(P)H-dependent glycerol-3-phosphate dehydrogenase ['Bituminaria bituminosa' little leaf phytoplasma]MDV3148808.1 NAD(P)-binding domain-containing protein [Pigeon pea little leaf phytoplasma]MDO7983598.1 NAD(P)-binding domain-containing protein ['Bituminaria bituminosa' little leaf phytoplasma]MDO8023753.1 NAD(P)-binding domain-containing protein ['Bituminaria bituminosa' little leaf phytoplasma]MDO8030428.1 NAD(P)-binding domain-containing protein ['Bituminaria bituminosa' little leaf phy
MNEKISIIGGGAWGTTLAQVLADNGNLVLVCDNNIEYVNRIKKHKHSVFDKNLNPNIQATFCLSEALLYSESIILCIPAQKIRLLLREINSILKKQSKNFINASKGIEVASAKTIQEIINEELDLFKIKNYGCIMGPSHAEEVINCYLTFLVAASLNSKFTNFISHIFANANYLKIVCSNDVYGCEICSAFKNVLSLISGILDMNNFKNNAKSAFFSIAMLELYELMKYLQFSLETILGVAGLGDLIVTSFNEDSRNYRAGIQIGLGIDIKKIYLNSCQTIEGINNLKAFYHLMLEKNLKLPIIKSAYQVVIEKKPVNCLLETIINKFIHK